jgi:hypothetical protein
MKLKRLWREMMDVALEHRWTLGLLGVVALGFCVWLLISQIFVPFADQIFAIGQEFDLDKGQTVGAIILIIIARQLLCWLLGTTEIAKEVKALRKEIEKVRKDDNRVGEGDE